MSVPDEIAAAAHRGILRFPRHLDESVRAVLWQALVEVASAAYERGVEYGEIVGKNAPENTIDIDTCRAALVDIRAGVKELSSALAQLEKIVAGGR